MHRLTRHRFLAGGIALAAFGASRFARAKGQTIAAAAPTPTLPQVIRVHLFSGLSVTRVEITGIAPLLLSIGTAMRSLPSIIFDATGALTGELTNLAVGDAPVTVRSNAPLTINAFSQSGSLALRQYDSPVTLQRSGAAVLVVNEVALEPYVAATLASEISPSWAAECLKAQAIVSRTYGVRAAAHSAARPYDVTDDTSNQVFTGVESVVPACTSAAAATAGMTLQAAGQPADVFYSATCGGHTADSQEITGHPGPDYLQGVPDSENGGKPFCTFAPFFAWENTVKGDDLARVVGDLADIQVKDRWNDGRVKTVKIVRTVASSYDMDARQFYAQCASVLGYKVVPSTMFEVIETVDGYLFKGHGLGHGVGMCQWGARGRANAGQQAAQIVEAYFPGTILVNPTLH